VKKIFIFCLLFCITGSVFAFDGFFAGIGAEVNANTREGTAAAGALFLGFDLNNTFALGIKAGFSSNFDSTAALEPLAFLRYYLFPHLLFLQAEAGGSFILEEGKSYPAFLGGIGVGWRFNFGNLYIEPYARGGYPFMWGIGLTAGVSINREQKAVNNEQ
jgi:hypothetical protein